MNLYVYVYVCACVKGKNNPNYVLVVSEKEVVDRQMSHLQHGHLDSESGYWKFCRALNFVEPPKKVFGRFCIW